MKVQNFKQNIAEYELYPKVVRCGISTDFTLRGLGMEAALQPGCSYIIRMIPQEEISTAVTLRIGDDKGYDEIAAMPDESGCIHFTYRFPHEEIYTARVLKKEKDGLKKVVDLRIFSAEEDLWERTPMRGNTHCHVCPSVDGHEDPVLAAAMYRKAGYDYLAITDHHKMDGSLLAIDGLAQIPHGIALYPGEEVHVPNAYIHAVNVGASFEGVGLDAWYHAHEKQCNREVENIAKALPDTLPEGVESYDLAWRIWIAEKIHEKGGIAIIAHPFWEYDAHNTRNSMFKYLTKEKIFDAVEVLAGQEPGSMEANMQVAFWNDMRAEGLFIPVLGCDDAHRRHYNWDYESCFNKVYTLIFARNKAFDGFAEAVRGGYTGAVDVYDGGTPRVHGTYRMVRYAIFLLEQYFPIHDELCFVEGCLLKDAYLGDREALEALSYAIHRIEAFEQKFFGREG